MNKDELFRISCESAAIQCLTNPDGLSLAGIGERVDARLADRKQLRSKVVGLESRKAVDGLGLSCDIQKPSGCTPLSDAFELAGGRRIRKSKSGSCTHAVVKKKHKDESRSGLVPFGRHLIFCFYLATSNLVLLCARIVSPWFLYST
ncbi:hypothetical protein KCU81_g721, partial [Aureobasidium melanogenum]